MVPIKPRRHREKEGVFKVTYKLIAIITKEEEGYVALCPEIDVVSQGNTFEEAKANLQEAVNLYIESFGTSSFSGREH